MALLPAALEWGRAVKVGRRLAVGIVDCRWVTHLCIALRTPVGISRISSPGSAIALMFCCFRRGAFPTAMERLHGGLAVYLQRAAQLGRPLIGICLGMQLLADILLSLVHTWSGVNSWVRGDWKPRWHIGWNSLEVAGSNTAQASDGG